MQFNHGVIGEVAAPHFSHFAVAPNTANRLLSDSCKECAPSVGNLARLLHLIRKPIDELANFRRGWVKLSEVQGLFSSSRSSSGIGNIAGS